MKNINQFKFEILIMDLCEQANCKTKEDYEKISHLLHESIEIAIQNVCIDENIDYIPNYD